MSTASQPRPMRVTSIDAARGLVMFAMIFVNDIAGVSHQVVPDWLRHFNGRSGMTFVDLVFPAFLFIVGMSIPCALGARLRLLGPEQVLARGYSITLDARSGKVIRAARQTRPGQKLKTRLQSGVVQSVVEGKG